MRKRIAAGLLAFALAFTAMDFGGLVSIQANAAGLVQVTEENQSNFHLNGDYADIMRLQTKKICRRLRRRSMPERTLSMQC